MYSYENYDKVKFELEKRRRDAVAQADARSAELRERSEELREIDAELSGTGLLLFKTACSGGDITPIRERNQYLVEKRREVIKSLGYPEDYTDVHYTCKNCSDTGFIGGTKMCSCFREALIKATIASSGIGELIDKQTFENFDLNWYKGEDEVLEKMNANLAAAKSYVKNFAKKRSNLLLIGKTGTGKTHISTAIAREIISQGFDVVYDSAQNIVADFEADKFRSGYGTEPKSEKYLECDLLIIDDLGTEFSSQFTVSCLYNLINTRANRAMATIISTNLSAEELAIKYEDRIYSRLVGVGTRVLVFEGRDRRIFG
jgi:DNA replication protein DnaC